MMVTAQGYPGLHRAFRLVEVDNGAHLIGTVYPGPCVNLDMFDVPNEWMHLCEAADLALCRLYSESAGDFETFVVGEYSDQNAICARQGDMASAHKLLNDWFNGWQPEDQPVKP
jgi:hypothetical protein